ncbi:MAG: DUF177 domain-containing protein [Gammaproteobacteria bacterium]|nr:DUF177 domain-containing protein [Gammaproteobacteria bacterium]MCP5137181.1 DUF177 domain-containing protein [Gammaproteobacteria bacterium]
MLDAVIDVGDVDVELEFGVDVGRIRFISGSVKTRVSMPCQRCLEPMSIDIDARVHLGIVIAEAQIDRLPTEYEPLLIGEDLIDPAVLVEDELLLALPLAPRHEPQDCPAWEKVSAGSEGGVTPSGATKSTRPNPFAVLASLKDKH